MEFFSCDSVNSVYLHFHPYFAAMPVLFTLSIVYCVYILGPWSLLGQGVYILFYPIMVGLNYCCIVIVLLYIQVLFPKSCVRLFSTLLYRVINFFLTSLLTYCLVTNLPSYSLTCPLSSTILLHHHSYFSIIPYFPFIHLPIHSVNHSPILTLTHTATDECWIPLARR